jgi:polar amino acid transport system substrate-binding protein
MVSDSDARAELAPTGVLRAAINTGNFLLVTGRGPAGEPQGVAPDMAAEVARRLGVGLALVPFARPNALADAADDGVWDIGLIGAEPARAARIAFASAYAEIEATYLALTGSNYLSIADVDRPGVRIAVLAGAAYDLWLERNLRHATLVRRPSADGALQALLAGEADVLAGLRPALQGEAARRPGTRVLDGRFTAVQQAIGTRRENGAGAEFLQAFVTEAIASGFVAELIERHQVAGRLAVAEIG